MDDERMYLVPDYFPDFHCKMGACRKPCCEGWPVSITMTDYFRLLGVDCPPHLRRKLDTCLHLSLHPTPDAYAQITPRWDGNCPLHMEDGRCALHAELGEEYLAAVCRLYPRGARTGEHRECSCANSCEAIPEMFLQRTEPIRFISIPFSPGLPDAQPRRHAFYTAGREQELRLWLISILQNRAYSLPQRILHLGDALTVLEDAIQARDDIRIAALLDGTEKISVPDTSSVETAAQSGEVDVVTRLLNIIDERSDSVRTYGVKALNAFAAGGFRHYKHSEEKFNAFVPQWQTWFEHMLVNHTFFAQFPFQDRPIPLYTEFLSLCAIYVLLRFLCLGCIDDCQTIDDVVDIVAAAFRLVDHTTFDHYAGKILLDIGCGGRDMVRNLLSL